MKWLFLVRVATLSAGVAAVSSLAQAPTQPVASGASPELRSASGPVPLEWTPPTLAQLSAQAAVKSNFTLDRTLLGVAAGMLPDSEADARQAVRKLDGVSVHMLRFGAAGITDEADVDAIRQAYHLRGWKHLVTTTSAGGPVHNETTDVWLVLDGANMRGAVVLMETPRSLSLVTVAGNLDPVDLLHLRGHFGIPRFEGETLKTAPR